MMGFFNKYSLANRKKRSNEQEGKRQKGHAGGKLRRPTRDFNEFFAHVKRLGYYPGTVIDAGAARGTPPIQEAFPDSYFIWFEPLKEFISDLEKLKSKYRGEVHNCALMSSLGEGTIFKTDDLYGSSVMHRISGTEDKRLDSIKIRTLDAVLEGKDFPMPYMLKVDCQGGDYDVVQGGVATLKKCDLVILEVSFFKFWGDHHPEPLEILNFMDRHGFAIYDILDGLFRPLDNALGQVDFVFVRKDGMFRRCHKWV